MLYKQISSFLILALFPLASLAAQAAPARQTPPQAPQASALQPANPMPVDELTFKTGYEPGEATATPPNEITWMVFNNTSLLPRSVAWPMSVFYEAPGTVLDRCATIADDPNGSPNKALHFWLKNAVIDAGYQNHTKGRVQTGFSGPLVNAIEVYSKQRMYIHADLNHLHSYPPLADPWWLGIIVQELWIGASWLGDPNPSRIILTSFSYGGKMRLELQSKSAETSTVFWSVPNLSYELPVGEWLTMELGYRMGNATTGRMVLIITRESTGQRQTVFDVTDWTYDPAADLPGGPGPRPLTHWNPQKLYASDNVIHHIRSQGGVLQAYWDDFGFSGAWPNLWP